MKLLQTKQFEKHYKKLHKNQQRCVDKAVALLQDSPEIGEMKKGDLSGIRVYKFRMLDQVALLGYSHNNRACTLMLLAIGVHENFYRDLKKG